MHLCWTSSFRVRLGCFLALGYLLCVLAPGLALALGSGLAPCLEDQAPVVAAAIMHMHGDEALHERVAMDAHHHAGAESPGSGHHDKKSPGPCCAMMCATALPADLPVIARSFPLISICASAPAREIEGEAPPLLYRPPIA